MKSIDDVLAYGDLQVFGSTTLNSTLNGILFATNGLVSTTTDLIFNSSKLSDRVSVGSSGNTNWLYIGYHNSTASGQSSKFRVSLFGGDWADNGVIEYSFDSFSSTSASTTYTIQRIGATWRHANNEIYSNLEWKVFRNDATNVFEIYVRGLTVDFFSLTAYVLKSDNGLYQTYTASTATVPTTGYTELTVTVFDQPYRMLNDLLYFRNTSLARGIAFSISDLAQVANISYNGTSILASHKIQTIAGTTASAPLRILAGVAPTSPASGDIWNEGAYLLWRNNTGTRYLAHTAGLTTNAIPKALGVGILGDSLLSDDGTNLLQSSGHFRNLGAATSDSAFVAAVTGDSLSRWVVYADGKTEWGAGGAASRDTNLYRASANLLKSDDNFEALSIKKTGGTSSQFLKADGSVDSNTYLTANQSITLSGEASGTGTTSISVTLANSAVIGKLLTGYVATSGVISATDSILTAFGKTQNQITNITSGIGNGTFGTYEVPSNENTGNQWVKLATITLTNTFTWTSGGISIKGGYNGRIFAEIAFVLTSSTNGTLAVNNPTIVVTSSNGITPSTIKLIITSDYPSTKTAEIWYNCPSTFTSLIYSFNNIKQGSGSFVPNASPVFVNTPTAGTQYSGTATGVFSTLRALNLTTSYIPKATSGAFDNSIITDDGTTVNIGNNVITSPRLYLQHNSAVAGGSEVIVNAAGGAGDNNSGKYYWGSAFRMIGTTEPHFKFQRNNAGTWNTFFQSSSTTNTSLDLQFNGALTSVGIIYGVAPWANGQAVFGGTSQAGQIVFKRGTGAPAAYIGYASATEDSEFRIQSNGGGGFLSLWTSGAEKARLTSTGDLTINAYSGNKALVSNGSKAIVESAVTSTELGYVAGVTSSIQTQLNGKQATLTNPVTGTGSSDRVTAWSGTNTITSYTSFTLAKAVNGAVKTLQLGGTSAAGYLSLARASDGGNVLVMGFAASETESNQVLFQHAGGSGYFQWNTNFSSVTAERMKLSNNGYLSIQTLNINTVVVTDGSKNLVSSGITTTKLNYLTDVTSNIQSQINSKQDTLTNPVTGTGTTWTIPVWTGTTTLGNSSISDNGSYATIYGRNVFGGNIDPAFFTPPVGDYNLIGWNRNPPGNRYFTLMAVTTTASGDTGFDFMHRKDTSEFSLAKFTPGTIDLYRKTQVSTDLTNPGISLSAFAPNITSGSNIAIFVGKGAANLQSGGLVWIQGATDADSYLTLETFSSVSPIYIKGTSIYSPNLILTSQTLTNFTGGTRPTYRIRQEMATNDYWEIYGEGSVANSGSMVFELGDDGDDGLNGPESFIWRSRKLSSSTTWDRMKLTYNSLNIKYLEGSGTRAIVADSTGTLLAQTPQTFAATLGTGIDPYMEVEYQTFGQTSNWGIYLNGSATATVGIASTGMITAIFDTNFNLVSTGAFTGGTKTYNIYSTNTLWNTWVTDVSALAAGYFVVCYSFDAISNPTAGAKAFLREIGSTEISEMTSGTVRRGFAFIFMTKSFGIIETCGRRHGSTPYSTNQASRGRIKVYKSNLYNTFDFSHLLDSGTNNTSVNMKSSRFGRLTVGRNTGISPWDVRDIDSLSSQFNKNNSSFLVDGNATIGGILNIDGTFGSSVDNSPFITPALMLENKLVMYVTPTGICGSSTTTDIMIGSISSSAALTYYGTGAGFSNNPGFVSNLYLDADNSIKIGTLDTTSIYLGKSNSSNVIYITGTIYGNDNSYANSTIQGFDYISADTISAFTVLNAPIVSATNLFGSILAAGVLSVSTAYVISSSSGTIPNSTSYAKLTFGGTVTINMPPENSNYLLFISTGSGVSGTLVRPSATLIGNGIGASTTYTISSNRLYVCISDGSNWFIN